MVGRGGIIPIVTTVIYLHREAAHRRLRNRVLPRCLVGKYVPEPRPVERRIPILRCLVQQPFVEELPNGMGKLFQEPVLPHDLVTLVHRGGIRHRRPRSQRIRRAVGHVGNENGNLLRGSSHPGQPSALSRRKMFAHGVDLANRRPRKHQRSIGRHQVFQRDAVIHRLLDDRRGAAADQVHHQRARCVGCQRFQDRIRCFHRICIWRRMTAAVITKSKDLCGRRRRARHDARYTGAEVSHQRLNHRVRRLAHRHNENPRKRPEIEKIFSYAQDPAIELHVAVECLADARLAQRVQKDLARHAAISRARIRNPRPRRIGQIRHNAVNYSQFARDIPAEGSC